MNFILSYVKGSAILLLSSQLLHKVESEIAMVNDTANLSYNSRRQTNCATLSYQGGSPILCCGGCRKELFLRERCIHCPPSICLHIPVNGFSVGGKQIQFSFPLEHPGLSSFKLYMSKGSVSTYGRPHRHIS
jgi:hypothetical protein